ncbi:hypothetical protein Mame01_34220 [Microbispora amethystogenes]|nr:hypothetical protein Mame01_34220 [Microbispora amethystogenes]
MVSLFVRLSILATADTPGRPSTFLRRRPGTLKLGTFIMTILPEAETATLPHPKARLNCHRKSGMLPRCGTGGVLARAPVS